MIHLSGKLSYEDQATPEGDQINQIPPYIVRSWSTAVNPWCSREEGNTHQKSGKQRIPPQTLCEPGQLWGLWGQGLTKDWGVLIGGGGKQLLLEKSSMQLTKIPRAAHSVTLLSTAMAHHTRRRSRLTVFSLLGAYMWTFHLRLEKVTPTGRYRLLQAYGLCPPLALELPGVSFLCAGSSFSRHPHSPISIPLRRALPAPPHEVPAALAWRHPSSQLSRRPPVRLCPQRPLSCSRLVPSSLCSADAVDRPPGTLCSRHLEALSSISLCSLTAHPSILSMVLLSHCLSHLIHRLPFLSRLCSPPLHHLHNLFIFLVYLLHWSTCPGSVCLSVCSQFLELILGPCAC